MSYDLWDLYLATRKERLAQRLAKTDELLESARNDQHVFGIGQVLSEVDREVRIRCAESGRPRSMLMFASNSYLNLNTHPALRRAAKEAINSFGLGTGGSAAFNGHTRLHQMLEERFAELLGTESAILFPSGYAANVGVVSGLLRPKDRLIGDDHVHASCWDGAKTAGVRRTQRFRHNDLDDLREHLGEEVSPDADTYAVVESVYSMEGDRAPLPEFVALCEENNAIWIVDNAHGVGVYEDALVRDLESANGVGGVITASFAKGYGVPGGVAGGSSALMDHLRFLSRSHVFSTSLSPVIVAAALEGMDLLERDPTIRERLWMNVEYLTKKLTPFGVDQNGGSPIVIVPVPEEMDAKKAAKILYDEGILVNYSAFPAVPREEQRFRICVMSRHTNADLDRLEKAFERVWSSCLQGA